jgi:quercetin dioxygenase-like cupin family protein
MQTESHPAPVVLTADEIELVPPRPLGNLRGISNRVLWQSDNSIAGVLSVDAGHRLGAHTHHANHHHMWVLDGTAMILGSRVTPGSYIHIPAGVEHDIDATSSEGCTVYYLYLQPPG